MTALRSPASVNTSSSSSSPQSRSRSWSPTTPPWPPSTDPSKISSGSSRLKSSVLGRLCRPGTSGSTSPSSRKRAPTRALESFTQYLSITSTSANPTTENPFSSENSATLFGTLWMRSLLNIFREIKLSNYSNLLILVIQILYFVLLVSILLLVIYCSIVETLGGNI